MKVIFDPKIRVLSVQTFYTQDLDKFLSENDAEGWTTDTLVGAERVVEVAGRICYLSFAKPRPGGNEAYLKHIKQVGHGSVLEHAVWTMLIEGISRSLSHELVRHRAGWAYSQLSQRYVDESVCEVVVPPQLREEVDSALTFLASITKKPLGNFTEEEVTSAVEISARPSCTAGLRWVRNMLRSNEDYKFLSNYLFDKVTAQAEQRMDRTAIRKDARGAARSVLPNATETKIVATFNLRAARHFLEMRASPAAEPEIRKTAYAMYQRLLALCPNGFGDYTEKKLPDGTIALDTPYRKV